MEIMLRLNKAYFTGPKTILILRHIHVILKFKKNAYLITDAIIYVHLSA